MEGIKVEGAIGLKITPVSSSGIEPFEVRGEVGYKDFPECGRIYYCKGSSYPHDIAEVIEDKTVIVNIPLIINDNKKITFYPYRTAIVRDVFVEMDRNDSAATIIENKLAKLAGVSADNHTAYAIDDEWSILKPVYVSFSDFKVRFGTSLEVKNW